MTEKLDFDIINRYICINITILRFFRKAAAKFRFYPIPEQETLLMQSFGCARKVWNMTLDACKKNYKQKGKCLNAQERNAFLTALKKNPEYDYLNKVSSVCLQQKVIHLGKALDAFFKNVLNFLYSRKNIIVRVSA